MKKTLIIFVVLFTTLNLFSQIAADISGEPYRPVSPPYPLKGFNFANACERNFNVNWVGRIFRNSTNSCTSTLQKFNSSTLNWDVVMTNNHVAILNNPNIWRYKVTQKGTYRVVFTNVIENSVAKPGYTINLGNVNFAYADNANFLLKYRSGTLFYSNTSYPQSNPLRICKRELFNSELNIQSILQMYNWSMANGYSGEIGHDITLEFEDPNGQVMQVPNFQNYMQIISVAPLFDFKIFEKGQGNWFADQANQMVEDYFNQIGGVGNGNFRLTVIIENGCNQSIKTESMYINISENEPPFQFSFNTNSKNSSTDASLASTQDATIFSSCNTGLKLNITGSGSMLQGSYKIDIVSMDNTGQPNPSNILWQGVSLTGNNGSIPSEILYNNITGATGASLLSAIQNTPSLQGTNLFLRITVVESCDGTKVNQTEQYYKVKFNAPVTSSSLAIDFTDLLNGVPGKNRSLTTGLSQATATTSQTTPYSVGYQSGRVEIGSSTGGIDEITIKVKEVTNNNAPVFNNTANYVFDANNMPASNFHISGLFSLNTIGDLHDAPYTADYYSPPFNNMNKIYRMDVKAKSLCPNVPEINRFFHYQAKGNKTLSGPWNTGVIALRSAIAIGQTIEESNVLFVQSDRRLDLKLSLAENSSFSFDIIDLNGRKMDLSMANSPFEKGVYRFDFDLNHYSTGVYIIKYSLNGEPNSLKIQLK